MTLSIGTLGYTEIEMVLLIGKLGYNIRYTSEYILKLQIHQHFLLTRKVFSRHNLSAHVFFSVSSGSSMSFHHVHLRFIFIFKLSSSSSHLHIQVIFIFKSSSSSDLDHHWNIITGSGSSLDLDHHYWIIITGSSQVLSHDSSHHRKFYKAGPFSC